MDVDPHKQIIDSQVVILPIDRDTLPQVLETYLIGYGVSPDYDPTGDPECVSIRKLGISLDVFPEGQFMAYDVATERVVGMASSMITDYDDRQPLLETWSETTGNGSIRTHNPNGNWLYGVDCVVLREYRGQGIGGRLIKARHRVARELNLRGMIAGSMPIDYHTAAAEGVSIEDYVADVAAGRRWDTNLSKQLKKGFRVANIIPDYMDDSPYTHGYAVAILWDNPAYRAPKTPPQKQRKMNRGATVPRYADK